MIPRGEVQPDAGIRLFYELLNNVIQSSILPGTATAVNDFSRQISAAYHIQPVVYRVNDPKAIFNSLEEFFLSY